MGEPSPPRVSLVLATVGRVREVATLFASLGAQTSNDFEVVVIDQNSDERLAALIDAYSSSFRIQRIRGPRGLSRSRNAGLALARGSIIAFPDDDCRYRRTTISDIVAWFDAHPQADGLTGRAVSGRGERAPARFARRTHWLDSRSVWVGGMSSVIFLRSGLVRANGAFDEHLGLGAQTTWTAAEESDYLARAIAAGARVRYEPAFEIDHPGHRGRYTAESIRRGESYGRALGYVMRKNNASPAQFTGLVLRAWTGAALALLTARIGKARFHWRVAAARRLGWRERGDCVRAEGAMAREPLSNMEAS